MILQIGNLQFESDISYESIQQVMSWKWEEIPRLGTTSVLHYAHTPSPTFSCQGTWWNTDGSKSKLADIEAMGDTKEPLSLVDDAGRNYGYWIIETLTNLGSIFRYGFPTAMKNEWELTLKYFGETPRPGTAGRSVASQLEKQFQEDVENVSNATRLADSATKQLSATVERSASPQQQIREQTETLLTLTRNANTAADNLSTAIVRSEPLQGIQEEVKSVLDTAQTAKRAAEDLETTVESLEPVQRIQQKMRAVLNATETAKTAAEDVFVEWGKTWGTLGDEVEDVSEIVDEIQSVRSTASQIVNDEVVSEREVESLAGDTLDLVVYREFGHVDTALLKTVSALNPDLIPFGPILPPRMAVRLPEIAIEPPLEKIKLF